MLKRQRFEALHRWYFNSSLRKTPCVLFGARQVGKTTLAEAFARETKREVISVNFWKDRERRFYDLFQNAGSALDVLRGLELLFERKISQDRFLLVLDEIQACPRSYSLLKSFKEDTHLPVIATGSYLKLYLSLMEEPDFINPLGCTHELLVTPLSFSEYLLNRNSFLYEKFCELKIDQVVDKILHEKLLSVYYEYLFVGGMPEPCELFINSVSESLFAAQELTQSKKKDILQGIENDFLLFQQEKRVSRNVSEKLGYIFSRIAMELQGEHLRNTPVQRFKFSSLGKHVTYQRVANIFDYLSCAGLIIRSNIIQSPQQPLLKYSQDKNAFKCFYSDVGLLTTKLGLSFKSFMDQQLSFYKGPIAENFVAQQLYGVTERECFSWKSKHHEIEFLLETSDGLCPLEVKSSERSCTSPSLTNYCKHYHPHKAFKIAPRNFGQSEVYYSVPIYMVEKLITYTDCK